MTVYTANVLLGIPESVFQVSVKYSVGEPKLTIAKVHKVYGETYRKFRQIRDWLSWSVRDRGEELHTRHTWVIMVDR